MMHTYSTFQEKDACFSSSLLNVFSTLCACLQELQKKGYFFRGQPDASWCLYTSAQREYLDKDLKRRFTSAYGFIKALIVSQTRMAHAQYVANCKRITDVSVLSVMQHYGAPSPFLDFTSKGDVALYFATANVPGKGGCETNAYVSIYAFQPGNGPATADCNDITNWVDVVEAAGGDDSAYGFDMFRDLHGVFIRDDSKEYGAIANPRQDLQRGLFVYSGKAHNQLEPYETVFNGHRADCVKEGCDSRLFLPKFTCLNIHKCLLPSIHDYLSAKKISKQTLGLDGHEWARVVYKQFLAES